MLVGAVLTVKTIPGVLRPAITSIMPQLSGNLAVLVDVGANADCKPEYLPQFGALGRVFARQVYRVQNPRVGLVNIGEEEGKGNILCQAAYPLMKETKMYNFVGNVEGRGMFYDVADVLVCDGFTGNGVVLKLAESFYEATTKRALMIIFIMHLTTSSMGAAQYWA